MPDEKATTVADLIKLLMRCAPDTEVVFDDGCGFMKLARAYVKLDIHNPEKTLLVLEHDNA